MSLPPLYFLILSEQNEVSTFRTLNLKMTLRNLNYRIMINRFVLNEVSYFGPGAREVLPQEIKRLGLKKAFVSTDKDLIKFGVADKVLSVLNKAGIPYVVFSDIKPNPTVSNVNAGVKAFAESGADFILLLVVVLPSIHQKLSALSLIIRNSVMWFLWKEWRRLRRNPCLSLLCLLQRERLPK